MYFDLVFVFVILYQYNSRKSDILMNTLGLISNFYCYFCKPQYPSGYGFIYCLHRCKGPREVIRNVNSNNIIISDPSSIKPYNKLLSVHFLHIQTLTAHYDLNSWAHIQMNLRPTPYMFMSMRKSSSERCTSHTEITGTLKDGSFIHQ